MQLSIKRIAWLFLITDAREIHTPCEIIFDVDYCEQSHSVSDERSI